MPAAAPINNTTIGANPSNIVIYIIHNIFINTV